MNTSDLTTLAPPRASVPVKCDIDALIALAAGEVDVIPSKRSTFKAAWSLARVFKSYAVEPSYLYPAVERFCQLQGRSTLDFYDYFRKAFDKVRYGAGEDPLEIAWVAAEFAPYPCRDQAYGRFVGTIYHLSRESPDRTFYVARGRIRELAGLSSTAVTGCLRYAMDEGLVECVDSDYSFHHGKGGQPRCKIYRFIGPALPQDCPDDAPDDSPDDVAYDDVDQFDDELQPCLVS